jgi:hypothetical protein
MQLAVVTDHRSMHLLGTVQKGALIGLLLARTERGSSSSSSSSGGGGGGSTECDGGSSISLMGSIDLSSAGVVDYTSPTVNEGTPLSQVSLLFAVHRSTEIFVVDSTNGALIGFIDAESMMGNQ